MLTYEQETEMRCRRAREEALEQGIEQGIEQGEARSAALIAAMQRAGVSAEDILAALMGDDREALYRQYGVR